MRKLVLDIETTSLSPITGRVICIATLDIQKQKYEVFYDDDEKTMLMKFLEYFGNEKFEEMITYNGYFDLRFIFGRCLKYSLPSFGFFNIRMTDLMWTMKSVQKSYCYNEPGKLSEWSTMIFGNGKTENPELIPEMFEKGEINKILEYCENDVKITYELWKRIRFVLEN